VADDNLVDLEVDRIVDISWNTAAFESLVIDEGTKELILALVTNQLAAEKATDLIGGKGNGLIMLLHGYIFLHRTTVKESLLIGIQRPRHRQDFYSRKCSRDRTQASVSSHLWRHRYKTRRGGEVS